MVLMQVVKNNCFIFPGNVPDTPGRADPWSRLSRSRSLAFVGIRSPHLRGASGNGSRSLCYSLSPNCFGREGRAGETRGTTSFQPPEGPVGAWRLRGVRVCAACRGCSGYRTPTPRRNETEWGPAGADQTLIRTCLVLSAAQGKPRPRSPTAPLPEEGGDGSPWRGHGMADSSGGQGGTLLTLGIIS